MTSLDPVGNNIVTAHSMNRSTRYNKLQEILEDVENYRKGYSPALTGNTTNLKRIS